MSIFTKDCPQCAETNAAYAVRCKCGFSFNADDGAESQTEEEIALEEEKLYQEYLAARARQTTGTANDATKLAAAQPANQGKLNEAEQAKAAAEGAQAELKVQTTRVVESKPAKVELPAAPAVAQTPKVASTPPAAEPPASAPPVQAKVTEGTTESKPVKVEPPIPPAVTQTAKMESAPPVPKPPTATPPVQTTVPAATTQTQVPKPSGEAEQSWLISGAESDVQFDTPTELRAVKPATTTPAKPARPTPTATDVDAAKVSATERAKKLEQRLKEVQAKRDTKVTTMGANAINSAAAKPNSDSTSVAAAATSRPPTAPAAALPAPVKDPVVPRTLPAPTAVKTDDISAPSPSKLTSMVRKLTGMVLDAKPDQPQAVDKKTTPEPKKVNGTDTVPPASDIIEVPVAKDGARTPGVTATAKADLDAALQALHTKAPETSPAIPTPTESDNDADQADAVPEELLDTNTQAALGDLTHKSGLGCTEKECPNCTALVPMDAESCGCGFGFPTEDNAMPSLSLTDSDVEALEKRKKSSSISHLGK